MKRRVYIYFTNGNTIQFENVSHFGADSHFVCFSYRRVSDDHKMDVSFSLTSIGGFSVSAEDPNA